MLNLDALNEAQRKAVTHGEGPLLVLAGPGSGKTFTITQRILYLIEEMNVSPEEILVITFTKEAALSMQARFQEQVNCIIPVNFGTFHSVFYQILRKNNSSAVSQILRESQKKDLILPIIKHYIKTNQADEDCLSFLSAISYYKNVGDMTQTLTKLPEDKRKYFADIFAAYEETRRKHRAIDFDDMLYDCEKILQNSSAARNYWGKRFSHILMDEFQDINPRQYKIIGFLSPAPFNLFAVGDDDQSIYGFRGSRPACMQQFVEDYKAEKILLNINYRSEKEIVDSSSKVIAENKERFIKELLSNKREGRAGNVVSLHAFAEREEEYDYLAELLEKKEDGESCAVLFRTNIQLQSFAAVMNRKGISYEMKEKATGIYEHFIVKDIMAYLRIAAGENKQNYYLQILNKPARRISREALFSKDDIVSMDTIKEYYKRVCCAECENSYYKEAQNAIAIFEKQLNYLKKVSLYLGIQYICKVIGYERYLAAEYKKRNHKEQYEEWLQILEWLKDEAKHYDNLTEWIRAQEIYKEKSKDVKEKSYETREDSRGKIQLMTVHASKGLEFDTIYIPDCNEKVFPYGNMPDKESCEEERRIFYVGMTRAKKSLRLLYLIGTKERPRQPSRFLNPLLKT